MVMGVPTHGREPPWWSSSTGDLLPDAELAGDEAEIVNDTYFFFFFFESLLTSFDSFPTSFESFLTAVVIVVTCDMRSPNCVASSTSSTAGATAGREACLAVGHNVDATVKSVDLLGQLAETDQTENGNVLEESHAAGGRRLGYPGLFNDRLDLVLGTDSLGHSRYRRPGSPWSARVSMRTTLPKRAVGRVASRVRPMAPTPTLLFADELWSNLADCCALG